VIGPSYKPRSEIWKQYEKGMPWGDGAAKVYNVPWTPITLENADKLLATRQK
jgi:putative xylitol transport system substrate-binding protein